MDITFKSRHTSVPERFRKHAVAKLSKLEKLDQKAFRVDVQVSKERNPRQADHSERIELTIRSRGPAIRAEAAADDRYVALDLAYAKLEARLRRASERRKVRHGDVSVRSADVLAAVTAASAVVSPPEEAELPVAAGDPATSTGVVPIQMEGDGPLIVREKFHASIAMTIDQALLEMELVGHDFFAYHDKDCDKFSVVYRRCGYDYGVIRLVEELSSAGRCRRGAAAPPGRHGQTG
jgi:ribosomal subunit interface protein